VINPSQAQRSEADAWRHAFMPPDDRPEDVKRMIAKHNDGVRERCKNAPASE
jgi:hypothetical protein